MQHARPLPSHSNTVRRGFIYCAPLSAILFFSPVAAQGPAAPPQSVANSPDALKQREQELEAARLQQKNAAEQQARLKAEIAAIGEDRSKLNQQLIDIA